MKKLFIKVLCCMLFVGVLVSGSKMEASATGKEVFSPEAFDGELYQDLTSLSVEVTGLEEDTTKPVINQKNISVEVSDNIANIYIPITDAENDIVDIGLFWSYFDEGDNIWKSVGWSTIVRESELEKVEGGYLVKENEIGSFSRWIKSDGGNVSNNIDTFGIDTMWATDRAGNTQKIYILPDASGYVDIPKDEIVKGRTGLSAMPENCRVVYEAKENQCDMGNSNATYLEVVDLEKSSVSAKIAGPGDTITWEIVFNDGYKPMAFGIGFPNGYEWLADIAILKKTDKGYAYSFTVPASGHNGIYTLSSIHFYTNDLPTEINLLNSKREDAIEYYQDLSSLNVEVTGLTEDKIIPVINMNQLTVTFTKGIVSVSVPIQDNMSDIIEIMMWWSYFDEIENRWKSINMGLEDHEFEVKNGIYTMKLNAKVIAEHAKTYCGVDSLDIVGLEEIWAVDRAGNKNDIHILPFEQEEVIQNERIGLDAVPQNYRFIYDETQVHQHTYGEWKITKEATCTEDGVKECSCECGVKYTVIIPATGYVKGAEFSKGNNNYTITKISGKKGTVTYTGTSKKAKTVIIPKTVKVDGITFTVTVIADGALKGNTTVSAITIPEEVTKIGKEAFSGCKKLKTITIKSTKLKSVGKNAIKGINAKATIKVPKSQLSKYKKLFKSSTGYKKTMKIKK